MSKKISNTMQLTDSEVLFKNIAKYAIKEVKEEEKKNRKKAILHNTNLLLDRYFDIKESIQDQDLAFFIEEEQIILSSVLRSKATTKLLLEYVDMCIDKLTEKFPDKSKIIKIMYLTPEYSHLTWEEKIFNIYEQSVYLFGNEVSERTIARWRSEMVDELALLLFKGDGIKIWTF